VRRLLLRGVVDGETGRSVVAGLTIDRGDRTMSPGRVASGSRPGIVAPGSGLTDFACCATGTAVAGTAQELSDCHLLFTQVVDIFTQAGGGIFPDGKPIWPRGRPRGAL
jgi:hypothetical protein